jgi:hypothetical protein
MGGDILSIRAYHHEMEDWQEWLLDLIPFMLVAPALQLGMVEPYLVQGVWFPFVCCWRELVVLKFVGVTGNPRHKTLTDVFRR